MWIFECTVVRVRDIFKAYKAESSEAPQTRRRARGGQRVCREASFNMCSTHWVGGVNSLYDETASKKVGRIDHLKLGAWIESRAGEQPDVRVFQLLFSVSVSVCVEGLRRVRIY